MKAYILHTFLIFSILSCFSQTKAELQKQQKRLNKEMQQINKLLFNEEKKEKNALEQLHYINEKISVRNNLITVMRAESKLLKKEVVKSEKKIQTLEKKLTDLKKNYASMIYKSYKSKSQQSRLMFVLSSDNFYQAYKRIAYMKQYAAFRKKQGNDIIRQTKIATALNDSLVVLKREKDLLVTYEEREKQKIEEAFPGGPPCLNKLASIGFGEGSRNNALFNVAVYYKQSSPDSWEDEIVKANMKFMDPPLSNSEVQQLIKSVNRKGYDKYRCKDAPINAVCQSGLCRTKRFGVGFGEEEMPVLGSLTKYSSTPPQWFLSVDKKRIELKSEQLYSPNLFALACLDQANLIVPIPKPKDWKQHFLKPMMQGLQEVEPLESLDPENELTGLLQDWTTNRQSARTMDDVFNKLPFTDEKKEFTYFRMEDFYNFCKRNHWEMDKTKTGNLLKRLTKKAGYAEDLFICEERVRIKKQQPRLIKIKTMKQTEASVSKTPYQIENF